jgi:hypothetical protein
VFKYLINTFFRFLQNNDNWLPDNDFNLDPFFADELLTNVADFGSQAGDLLMDDMLGLDNNSPMFNGNYSNNNSDPIYSSAASDSGLSSDNLDLLVVNQKFITNDLILLLMFFFFFRDINNDLDLLSSCLPSPASDHSHESSSPSEPPAKVLRRNKPVDIVPPVLKRSARSTKNNSRYGSAARQNNNSKKGKRSVNYYAAIKKLTSQTIKWLLGSKNCFKLEISSSFMSHLIRVWCNYILTALKRFQCD